MHTMLNIVTFADMHCGQSVQVFSTNGDQMVVPPVEHVTLCANVQHSLYRHVVCRPVCIQLADHVAPS